METNIIIFTALISVLLSSCTTDDVPMMPSYEGLVINSLTNEPFHGVSVSVTNGTNSKLLVITDENGKFKFSLDVEDLSNDYYIQVGNSNTETKTFPITGVGTIENNLGIITLEPDTKPQCKISEIELIKGVITLNGIITSSGYSEIKSVGFYLCKEDKVSAESVSIKAVLNGETFSASYEEERLDIATLYYFIPFAINETGEGVGPSHKFRSTDCTPIVDWDYPYPMNLTAATTVTMDAEIVDDGGSEIIESGFCWDTEGHPTIDSNKKYLVGTSKNYRIEIADLIPETKYYARPYVKNKRGGLGYGTILSFETKSGLPTVRSDRAIASSNKIDMWGNVTHDGGFTIKRCGFYYGTNPTTQDNVVESAYPQKGEFSVSASNVLDGTPYYARAFAENEWGIVYGDILSITTPVIAKFKVKDSNGIGIPEAIISVGNSSFSCDASGEKEIQVQPGTYEIVASASGYKTSSAHRININRTNKYFEVTLEILPEYIELPSVGLAIQTIDIGTGDHDSVNLMCQSSTVGGYNDWRLPTKEELMILYNNKNNIGEFKNDYYWSSSYGGESPFGTTYYYIDFEDGSISTSSGDEKYRARCVRTIAK